MARRRLLRNSIRAAGACLGRRAATVAWLACAAALGACSSGGSSEPTGTGGTSTGGSSTGGATGTGGSSSTGGAAGDQTATGGSVGTGGTSTGGSGPGGATATGGAASGGSTGAGASTGGPFPFKPPFILGADISWTLEDEAGGGKFVEGGVTRPIEQIMSNNGFNYIRLRTFVCPSCAGGYSRQGYCDTDHTVTMAKRVKACGLGLQIDFHMSDTWVSIGTGGSASSEPSQWAGKTPAEKAVLAHDYVKDVITKLVAAGATPDMVSIGNETNGGMSGIKISDWAGLSQVIAGAVKGVTEVNDKIIITCQNGRPRPDSAGGSNFTGWVDKYMSAAGGTKFRMDLIGGSTYGTTNKGADWTESFGYVIKTYNTPVCSMEYNDTGDNKPAGANINKVMRSLPNGMGWGSFVWEPDRDYSSSGTGPLFDHSGNTYTTNAAMAEYPAYAKSIGLPVPATKCVGSAYGN